MVGETEAGMRARCQVVSGKKLEAGEERLGEKLGWCTLEV